MKIMKNEKFFCCCESYLTSTITQGMGLNRDSALWDLHNEDKIYSPKYPFITRKKNGECSNGERRDKHCRRRTKSHFWGRKSRGVGGEEGMRDQRGKSHAARLRTLPLLHCRHVCADANYKTIPCERDLMKASSSSWHVTKLPVGKARLSCCHSKTSPS